MSNTPTYGGTSANQCAYCGNWHAYSEAMCRDIVRYQHLPSVTSCHSCRKATERACVCRERAAFVTGALFGTQEVSYQPSVRAVKEEAGAPSPGRFFHMSRKYQEE